MKKTTVHACVAFLLLVSGAALYGYRAYERERAAALAALERETTAAATAVDQRIARLQTTFSAEVPLMEAFLAGRERTDAEITEYLRERTRRLSTGVNANYVDLFVAYNGRYLCGNYWRPPAGFKIRSRPWYVEAMKAAGRTVIVPPYVPSDYPHQIMAISRKLADDVVLSLDVQLTAVEPTLGYSVTGRESVSFYLDSLGRLVTSGGHGVVRDFNLAAIADRIATEPGLHFVYGDNVISRSRSRDGWTAVTINSRSDVLSSARWALVTPFVWALLAFALIMFGAELVRHRSDVFAQWRRGFAGRGAFAAAFVYLFAIAVVILLYTYMRHEAEQREYKFIVDRVERQLHDIVVPYEAFINTAKGAAGYCSRHLEPLVLANVPEEAVEKETRRLVGIYRSLYGRNYRNIFVVQRGRYADSLGYNLKRGFDPVEQPWYAAAVSNPNSDIVSMPYTSPVDGTDQISITHVMTDPERTVVGIDISVKMLRTLCGRLYIPGAICSCLVAADGYVIDHRTIMGNEEHSHSDIAAVTGQALKEPGSFRSMSKDGERFIFSVPLSVGGRFIVSADARQLDEAMSEHRARMVALTVPLFVSLLISCYLALYRVRRFREREIAERERERQSERLEKALDMAQSANRAKSLFMSSMSHDLRTPMNAILGFADVAKAHLDDAGKVKDSLAKISGAAGQLLEFINSVLEMSHLEAGRVRLDVKPEDLGDILAGVDGLLRQQAEAKNLEFTVGPVPANTRIACDRTRLNQVLVNLVANAIKYTNPGGHISLTTSVAPVENGRLHCEFAVRDDGIGMSAEFAECVFEPFAREQTSTISGIQGTGLGLSIVKSLIEMMGGKIHFVTRLGKGTTFTASVDFSPV